MPRSTIVGLMTEEQLDRYEAFRRSSLKRPMRQVRACCAVLCCAVLGCGEVQVAWQGAWGCGEGAVAIPLAPQPLIHTPLFSAFCFYRRV